MSSMAMQKPDHGLDNMAIWLAFSCMLAFFNFGMAITEKEKELLLIGSMITCTSCVYVSKL